MKKIIFASIALTLAAFLRFSFNTPVLAQSCCGCEPYDSYAYQDHDGWDHHAYFDFHDGNHTVNISAESGYTITGVWLDLHGGGVSWAWYGDHAGNYDPSGSITIDQARAHVVKTCPTGTPTSTPTSTPSCTPTVTPSVTLTVTPTPTTIPEDPDETPTGTPEATPTPTETPSNGGTGGSPVGDGRSDGRSDGKSSCPECTAPPKTTASAIGGGQVLGATTDYAATGSFTDILMNAIGAIGGISTAAGLTMISKKKSK